MLIAHIVTDTGRCGCTEALKYGNECTLSEKDKVQTRFMQPSLSKVISITNHKPVDRSGVAQPELYVEVEGGPVGQRANKISHLH